MMILFQQIRSVKCWYLTYSRKFCIGSIDSPYKLYRVTDSGWLPYQKNLISFSTVSRKSLPSLLDISSNFPQFWPSNMLSLLPHNFRERLKLLNKTNDKMFAILQSSWPAKIRTVPKLTKESFNFAFYNAVSRVANIGEFDGKSNVCILPVYDLLNHGKRRNTFFRTKIHVKNNLEKILTYDLIASSEVWNPKKSLYNNKNLVHSVWPKNAQIFVTTVTTCMS